MMRSAVVVTLVAAVGLAGCRDIRREPSPSAARPAASPAGEAASTTVDTTFTGQASAEFCDLLRAFNDDTGQITASLNEPGTLRDVFRRVQTGIETASSVAPTEITADVRLVSVAYAQTVAELERVDFDLNRIPPAAFARFSSPEVQTATTRLDAFARNVCRVPR